MAYESYPESGAPHRVVLQDRSFLSVTGVVEVERFDENEIIMTTSQGTLAVRGENLHIEKLSLDGGELNVEGHVDSFLYEDDRDGSRGGLLARLFG